MKRVLSALALITFAVATQAQVTFVDGTERPLFANYNPNGAAGTLGPIVGGREDAMINTTAGILTATFLGFEALDTDTFTFTLSSGTLSNKGALNASISGPVSAGALNFTFADVFQGTAIGNGQNLGDFTSYAVLGSFAGAVFTPFTLGGAYDLILGFNDGMRVDSDYDDIVVGLTVAAIPEPETYAAGGRPRRGRLHCEAPQEELSPRAAGLRPGSGIVVCRKRAIPKGASPCGKYAVSDV